MLFRSSLQSEQQATAAVMSDFDKMFALAQIQATRDVEISEYRRNIQALQQKIEEHELREEQLKKMEQQLRSQIEHLEKLYSNGSGPNLEYLKNVLCKFLETVNDDKNDAMRLKLFHVIATILDMSPQEQEQIVQKWKEADNGSTGFSRWSLFGSK